MLTKADFSFVVTAKKGHEAYHTGKFETCKHGFCPKARAKLASTKAA